MYATVVGAASGRSLIRITPSSVCIVSDIGCKGAATARAKTTRESTCRTMRGKRSVGPLAEGESGSLSTKYVDEALSLWWHVDEQAWYESTLLHWKTAVSAESDDGVLGGYGSIDSEDTEGSLEFLSTNRQFASWHSGGSLPLPGTRALDCGAGVGRVSEGVLLKVCETVQLVEVPQP